MNLIRSGSAKSIYVSRFAEVASLVVAVLVLLLIGGIAYSDAESIREDRKTLKNVRAVREQIDNLLLALTDLESAQRGFVLTGNVQYLNAPRESSRTVRAHLAELQDLMAGEPEQRERFSKFAPLVEAKLAELDQVIQAQQTRGHDAAIAIVTSDRGELLMDQIRIATREMDASSEEQIGRITTIAQARSDRTRFVSVSGSLVLLILFVAATIIINRSTAQREQLTREIQESESETSQARDLLLTTLASISDGVISTDASGTITFLNVAAEQLTGWPTALAAGRPAAEVFRIVDEATLIAIESPLLKALRDGVTAGLANHTLLIAKDGRRIAIDDTAAPISGKSGQVQGAVLVFRDISERRKAERALEESEKRFRAAFARAPIGMVLTDTGGHYIHSNQAYCDIVGFPAEELPKIHFLSLAHPDDADRNQQLYQKLLAEEISSYVIEKRIFRRTGEAVWVRASATLMRDADGRADQIVGLVENIDSRKQAEAIVAAKSRLAQLGAAIGRALTQGDRLPETLQDCAQAIVDHVDAAFARIWTIDGTGKWLELAASAGMYTHLNGPHSRIAVGSYKIGLIASERKPHLTNDVATDERVSDRAWAHDNGILSFAGYPLILRDNLIGVVGMFSRNRLSTETLEALGSVANSIAIGIERKRGEEALLRQWQRFDTALSNTPDFIYTFDLKGRITYANQALLGIWQKTLAEVLERTFYDLGYPSELAERFHRQIQQVIDTRQPLRDQTPYTAPNGTTGYYEYIFSPVFAYDSRVEAVAGSTRDITEIKQAEEELRKSEERLSFALAAGGGVGTWDWNVPENRIYCNVRMAELLSIDPESAETGAPISAFLNGIHPGDRSWVSDSVQHAIATGEDFTAEYRILQGDGSTKWVYVRGRCHHDEAGRAARFPGVVFDITERKRVEHDLRESETRLAFIAETIPPMVWTAAPDGALDYVNRRVTQYFDVSEESVLGTGWLSFVHPDDLDATLGRWTRSLSTGEPYETSYRLRRGSDKAWRWHLARALAYLGDDGSIRQWFGTCTDIHDQKVAEAELLRANRELEEFAYVASHDLQEPLRMVNVYTQLLVRRFLVNEPEAEKFAGFINHGVNRMEMLIRDLLTFSRSVYRDERTLGPADLSVALTEARSLLKDRLDESGAVIISPALPVVHGDAAQLAHVFQNILSNAIKYRKKDVQPRIVISVTSREKEWIISFQDNGIGFDPQYAERIFGLFKRLHKDEYPGTGLGLAICQRIIEHHGGRVWAESKIGEGSIFHIALPNAETL